MANLTLLTGGAASGKSTRALRVAAEFGPRVLFVATCDPRDDEMRAKVARHRQERPKGWTTVETFRDISAAFTDGYDGAIVDCLTLLVSQLLIEETGDCHARDSDIYSEIESVCRSAKRAAYPVIVVTNEVGLGVVPETPLGRRFREVAGRANQIAAEAADTVEFLVCGIPWNIKHAR